MTTPPIVTKIAIDQLIGLIHLKFNSGFLIISCSVILSGVKIGDGAVIAANSVVTSDIPAYAIVGGSPAKVIKNRFDQNVIDRLKELKWWDWSEEKLKEHKHLFEGTITGDLLNSID